MEVQSESIAKTKTWSINLLQQFMIWNSTGLLEPKQGRPKPLGPLSSLLRMRSARFDAVEGDSHGDGTN